MSELYKQFEELPEEEKAQFLTWQNEFNHQIYKQIKRRRAIMRARIELENEYYEEEERPEYE